MAGPRPDSIYNPIPTESSGGGGASPFNVHASPQAFGSGVAEATSSAGKEAFETSNHYVQMDTESKANDDYANKYIPAVTQLRNDFDMLRGQDKIPGYENYIEGIQNLNSQFLENSKSPLEKDLMKGMISRHLINETQSAKRELVDTQKQLNDQSTYDLIKTQNDYAINNYSDPAIVDSTEKSNSAHIEKHYIDNGHNPTTEEGRAVIDEAQRDMKGKLAVGMISRAVQDNDAHTANNIRAKYSNVIPADQQLHLDNVLHQENIKQTGIQSIAALKTGNPLPNSVGAPPAQVQAVVANTAHSKGLDYNDALTVLRIESSNGQNVGTRGDIGQTGKGGDLHEQAANLVVEKIKSNNVATKALGRPATAAEGYVCYQQGEGGGPALLKAAQGGGNIKAVDVLAPFYKTRKLAYEAVVNNGGNATMTADDFVTFLTKKYDDTAKRAACDMPVKQEAPNAEGVEQKETSIGEAIVAPHITPGETVQPGATPVQALLNFNKKTPDLLSRVNAIPNIEERASVLKLYNQDKAMYEGAANAYTKNLLNQAGQLMAKSDFISMNQVPSEMYASLATDSPQTLQVMERRAEYNSKRSDAIPLDFSSPVTLGDQIASRVASAKAINKFGGKDAIFTPDDAGKLSQMWENQTTNGKLDFLNTLQASLPDKKDYRDVLQKIRPDSPVTAMAGEFLGLHNQMLVDDKFFDKNDIYVTPDVVAKRLLEGEELLNQTKISKSEDGQIKSGKVFPMPPDEGANGMREEFNNYVGNAFRGKPQLYNQAYQAYRAYYAAESANSGVYKNELDTGVATKAAKAVIGTAIDQNDITVIAPWGMDESTFKDESTASFRDVAKMNGLNPNFIDINDVQLENTGEPNMYRAVVGSGYVIDKEGKPVVVKVGK